MSLAHVSSSTLCSQNLSDVKLSPKQAVTLYFISQNEWAMQKDLAMGVGTSPTVMVGILDTLAARGFIKRISSKQDRRSQSVTLTKEGKNTLSLIKDAFFATEAALNEKTNLSQEEQTQLVKLLQKLTHRQEVK